MSKKKNSPPFLFQSLNKKKIKFTLAEQKIIAGLMPFVGGEFDSRKAIKLTSKVLRKDRDQLVSSIKDKLIKIQGNYCIYCGLHEDHCGVLEREHIAPKGSGSYPQFMFEPENLCLACHHCNFDLKGEENTIYRASAIYAKNKFSIVHPYFDDYNLHIEHLIKNGSAIIRRKPWSRKGKKTIELFELNSVPNTAKRSGLLIANEWSFDDKYDALYNSVLQKKYISV